MITAIIIDDEINNIDNLTLLLQKHCADVNVVSSALNTSDAREKILLHEPNLIFLDIQLPGENGFELLKSLPDYSFEIIFVTAHDQYGIEAVKFAAIDYLLKPIDINELKTAVKKVIRKNVNKNKNIQLENLIQLLKEKGNKEDHRLALPTGRETRFINPKNIIRCESTNNYTTFYLDDLEKLIISKPIYEYEELLKDYGFIRCHQSHLINKKFIKSWVKEDGGYLLLDNKIQIPISKQKKDYIKEVLSKK